MINFNQILFSSDISVTINEELKKRGTKRAIRALGSFLIP